MYPKAREDDLLVTEMGDEVILYDVKRHRFHNLNGTAAWVWKHCDGARSEAEIARCLAEETNTPVDIALVRLTLAKLKRARLLEAQPASADAKPTLSRRQFLRQAVMAAGLPLALPVITSLLAPTPTQARPIGENDMDENPTLFKDTCGTYHSFGKPVQFNGTGENCDDAIRKARLKLARLDRNCRGTCQTGDCVSYVDPFDQVLMCYSPERKGGKYRATIDGIWGYKCVCSRDP